MVGFLEDQFVHQRQTNYYYGSATAGGAPSSPAHPGLEAIGAVGQNFGLLSIMETSEKLIAMGSGSHSETTERAMKADIDRLFKLGSTNLTSARLTLSNYVSKLSVHYRTMKNYALDMLILLLENDPLTEESADGLLDVGVELMKTLSPKNIQGKTVTFQRKVAKAYYLTVENYWALYADKKLNAITDLLKSEMLNTDEGLKLLNTQGDFHLAHFVAMTKEGILRLKDNTTKYTKAFNVMVKLADGLGELSRKNPGNFLRKLGEVVVDLDSRIKGDWYDSYLAARVVAQKVLKNKDAMDQCVQLLVLTKTAFQHIHLTTSYLELLAHIARHSENPEIRQWIVTGIHDLELPGLIFFVYFEGKGEEHIHFRVAELLIEILNGTKDNLVFRKIKEALLFLAAKNAFKKNEDLQKLLAGVIPEDKQKRARWLEEVAVKPLPPSGPPPELEEPKTPDPSKVELERKKTDSVARPVFVTVEKDVKPEATQRSASVVASPRNDSLLEAQKIAQLAKFDKMECIKLLGLATQALRAKQNSVAISYAELLAEVAKNSEETEIRFLIVAGATEYNLSGLHTFLHKDDLRYRAAELLLDLTKSLNGNIVYTIKGILIEFIDQMEGKDGFKEDQPLAKLLFSAIPKDKGERTKWLEASKPKFRPPAGPPPKSPESASSTTSMRNSDSSTSSSSSSLDGSPLTEDLLEDDLELERRDTRPRSVANSVVNRSRK